MTELTPQLLADLMDCSQSRAEECFDSLVSACNLFNIESSAQLTCFLVQCKWESTGLQNFSELGPPSYFDKYNNRGDLGNGPHDGYPYRGSGPIQVTGRANFAAAQRALDAAGIGINIVANPDLARTVQYGFWISCWWWATHGGNQVAETQPLDKASLKCGRLVNRGNANSPYRAQGEIGRIAAYISIHSHGDLSLPGNPAPPYHPPTPDPGDELNDNDLTKILAGVKDLLMNDGDVGKHIQALVGNIHAVASNGRDIGHISGVIADTNQGLKL